MFLLSVDIPGRFFPAVASSLLPLCESPTDTIDPNCVWRPPKFVIWRVFRRQISHVSVRFPAYFSSFLELDGDGRVVRG